MKMMKAIEAALTGHEGIHRLAFAHMPNNGMYAPLANVNTTKAADLKDGGPRYLLLAKKRPGRSHDREVVPMWRARGVRTCRVFINCPALRDVATRLFTASVLTISLCASGFTQPQPCTVQVSIVVPDLATVQKEGADISVRMLEHSLIMPGAVGVADLTAEAFSAHDRKHPVAIRSLTIGRGPRRLAFVVENGKRMNAAARKIEAAVISGIVSKARPEDSFALITAGGPRMGLPFGSSRDTILATTEQLASPPQGRAKGQSALDAVHEATSWLEPPQAGDSIFVLALNLEGRHRTSFSKVRDALSSGRVRLFGLELGRVTQPNPENLDTASLMGGYLNISHAPVGSVDHLIQLSRDSGGIEAWEDTTKGKRYSVGQAQLERLVAAGESMYRAAVTYYVLELDCAGRNVVIGLLPLVREKFPGAFVLYPR